jgi:cbb3-type cytochrome oxidase subunit 3
MFTTGQIYFAIFFIIVFVAAMIYVYRKDFLQHKRYYKGSYKVLIGFLAFIALLFFIKFYLKEQ